MGEEEDFLHLVQEATCILVQENKSHTNQLENTIGILREQLMEKTEKAYQELTEQKRTSQQESKQYKDMIALLRDDIDQIIQEKDLKLAQERNDFVKERLELVKTIQVIRSQLENTKGAI